MTPTSGPCCGPVEQGFVERIPCPDTEQLAASVGGLCQSHLSRLDGFLNSKLALRRNVTAAVQAGLTPPRGQSDRNSFRFIGTCRNLRCTHSMYILTRQVFLGRCNEVWLHWFSAPPLVSFFILSPFHTLSFLLLFHVFPCFMSFHLTPFFLLRAHRSGP